MAVLMVNGSPHPRGCTYTALNEVASQLKKHGIESEIIHIGTGPVAGCISCGKCGETGYCIFKDDDVNATIDKLKTAEGLVVGSPVYYAAPNGALCAFLESFSSDSDNCPDVGIGPLLQFPHPLKVQSYSHSCFFPLVPSPY